VIQLEEHDAEGGDIYYTGIFDVVLKRRPGRGRYHGFATPPRRSGPRRPLEVKL